MNNMNDTFLVDWKLILSGLNDVLGFEDNLGSLGLTNNVIRQ